MGVERKKCVEKSTLKTLNKVFVVKGEMAEWFKAADCKSVEISHRRFESYSLLIKFY